VTGFRVVDTTTRVHSGFLEVLEATIEAPDGERLVRTIVRHPGAVTVVPVVGDGSAPDVLLVRQYRAAIGGELLEAPAGKRDVDGEPPEETARRELEEEVAHRAGRIEWLGECYTSPGFCDEYAYLYAAFDLTPLDAPIAVTAEEAQMTVERVPLDSVDELIARRELVDSTTIIALLLTRQLVRRRERSP
jgi:ADP-ribose pyrophosphatase